MLSLLLITACQCESPSPSAFSSSSSSAALAGDYVHWAGEAIGTCAYKDSVLDIAALTAIIIHAVLWSFLIFPQLRLNYTLKSASNLSLLYLSFWLASEVSFVIATVLEKWSWMWMALRGVRAGMCAILLTQTIYYKFYYRNEYSPAMRPGDSSRRYWKQRDLEGGGVGEEEMEYDDSDCDDGSMLQPYDDSGMITTVGKWPTRKPRRKSTASSGSETGALNPLSLDRYGSYRNNNSSQILIGSSPSIHGGGSSTHIGSYTGVGPSSLHSSASGSSSVGGQLGRKSSQRYGTSVTTTQQISWGEALLNNNEPSPRPMLDISSTPSTRSSRLPTSHAHLVSATPPRTISPMNTPFLHPSVSGSSTSSHATTLAHVQQQQQVAVMPNVDNERRKASYMASNQQQPTIQQQKSLSSNVAFHASPPSPSHISQSGATFHTSPSSAFTPILHSQQSRSDVHTDEVEEENIWDQPTPTEEDRLAQTHTPNPAVSSQQQQRIGGGPKNARLYTVGLCIMGLTYWSVGGGLSNHATISSFPSSSPSSSSSSDLSHSTGRVLLSIPSFFSSPSSSFSSPIYSPSPAVITPLSPFAPATPLPTSPPPSSLTLNDTNTTLSLLPHCNEPFNAQPPISILIRIFNWLGCVFAAMSFFPQYIYIDSYYHSTDGLSYLMYTLQLIGNFALLLGFSIPEHNDWISNRYNEQDSAFESWYLNQVIIPIMITQAFNFLQIWVLIVQRKKWKVEREDPYEERG